MPLNAKKEARQTNASENGAPTTAQDNPVAHPGGGTSFIAKPSGIIKLQHKR